MESSGEQSVLRIVGNPRESVLYLQDVPIHYSWYAEVGSTWRYHLARGSEKQAIEIHRGMQEMMRRGIGNEGDFFAISEYFNSFLAAGDYECGYYQLGTGLGVIECPEATGCHAWDGYGGLMELAETQGHFDEELAHEYKEAILKGGRPVIVLLHVENSEMFFILDGHHKNAGYSLAGIAPFAVIITKLGKQELSLVEARSLAQEMECSRRDYLDTLEREKKRILKFGLKRKLRLDKVFTLIGSSS